MAGSSGLLWIAGFGILMASMSWLFNGRKLPSFPNDTTTWGGFWGGIIGALVLIVLWALIVSGLVSLP